jgi:5-methylcytosine-specific restriction endonuclease McrA
VSDLKKDIKRFLIPVLRRATFRFKVKTENGYEYPRTQAKQAARVERGLYKCAGCGEMFKENETIVDHIDPVVALEDGFTDWDDFINRLFVSYDKLQILCTSCSEVKTLMEDNLRTAARQKRKETEKELKKQEKLNKKLAKTNKKE